MNSSELRHIDGSTANICGYGAHLISWRTSDGVERLFLSQRAQFLEGAAIRGGVPIVFPQFAELGSLPKHGFARTTNWHRMNVPSEPADSALFVLQDNAETHAIWPRHFMAEYRVNLGVNSLSMQLTIRNTGDVRFAFTAGLHTYLRVQDIGCIRIGGLQDFRYSNSASGGEESIELEPELDVEGEVDRIYFSTTRSLKVTEPGRGTLVCRALGFADTVVWNPGAEKASALADLEPLGYRSMLCIEAAAIATPIVLEPSESWSGTQILEVE